MSGGLPNELVKKKINRMIMRRKNGILKTMLTLALKPEIKTLVVKVETPESSSPETISLLKYGFKHTKNFHSLEKMQQKKK